MTTDINDFYVGMYKTTGCMVERFEGHCASVNQITLADFEKTFTGSMIKESFESRGEDLWTSVWKIEAISESFLKSTSMLFDHCAFIIKTEEDQSETFAEMNDLNSEIFDFFKRFEELASDFEVFQTKISNLDPNSFDSFQQIAIQNKRGFYNGIDTASESVCDIYADLVSMFRYEFVIYECND